MKIGVYKMLLFFLCTIIWSCQSEARVVDIKVDLIVDTCKKTHDFDFCVKTLRSDPRTAGSDVNGLAVVMLEKTLSYSKTTRDQIHDLLKKTTDNVTIQDLNICDQVYALISNLEGGIPKAIQILETRSKSSYLDAEGIASDAGDDAITCEDAFNEEPRKRVSPLTARNNTLFRLSGVALEIIISIVGNSP